MLSAPADLIGSSIVVTGFLDPTVLQPKTLFEHGLLTKEDAVEMIYDAVLPDLVNLRLPWMLLSAETNRLSASTTLTLPSGEPVRDFVNSLLQLMPRVNINQIGLNHECHIEVGSVEKWHAVGDKILPKHEIWNGLLDDPGMIGITIRSKKAETNVDFQTVRIEPSIRVPHAVYVLVNNHFELREQDPSKALNMASRILIEKWHGSFKKSQTVFDKIREIAYNV